MTGKARGLVPGSSPGRDGWCVSAPSCPGLEPGPRETNPPFTSGWAGRAGPWRWRWQHHLSGRHRRTWSADDGRKGVVGVFVISTLFLFGPARCLPRA